MDKSQKIKKELTAFWLKQLEHNRRDAIHDSNGQPSRLSPALALDPFLQRQLQRNTTQFKEKRAVNNSTVDAPKIPAAEKRFCEPAITVGESNHCASAADQLRQWLSQNVVAEQFEGHFYIGAVDCLSLEQAGKDWNRSTAANYEAARSRPDWLAIDDRLKWLSEPAS